MRLPCILTGNFIFPKLLITLVIDFKYKNMICTIYTPNSNCLSVPIPDKYIGIELEILILPFNEISTPKVEKKTPDVDLSFGGWAENVSCLIDLK